MIDANTTARVLIVDDNQDTTDSLATILKRWGHETRKAYDGESALQQALAFVPNVVLLDIGLPNIDGYEVAGKLRQYKKLARTRIVAITGQVATTDLQKCIDAGFDDHFAKPIDTNRLKSYLDELPGDMALHPVVE